MCLRVCPFDQSVHGSKARRLGVYIDPYRIVTDRVYGQKRSSQSVVELFFDMWFHLVLCFLIFAHTHKAPFFICKTLTLSNQPVRCGIRQALSRQQ